MTYTTPLRSLFLAGVAALGLSAAAHAQAIQPMQHNGITYMTGGIGLEERHAMEAAKGSYNLRILLSGLTGHFVGEALISIRDSKGSEVLSTLGGPIFYAQLPSGSYTVVATHNGDSKTQRITVGSSAKQIGFAWAAPAEGTISSDATRPGESLVEPYNPYAPRPVAPVTQDSMPEPYRY